MRHGGDKIILHLIKLLQLLGHGLEGSGQEAEFVPTAGRGGEIELVVALPHPLGGVRQGADRPCPGKRQNERNHKAHQDSSRDDNAQPPF